MTTERAEMLLGHVESIGREPAALAFAATAEPLPNIIRAMARLPIDPGAADARRAAARLFAR